jgi:hypothetical protein
MLKKKIKQEIEKLTLDIQHKIKFCFDEEINDHMIILDLLFQRGCKSLTYSYMTHFRSPKNKRKRSSRRYIHFI